MNETIPSMIVFISIILFFAFLLIIQTIFIIKSEIKDLRRIIDKLHAKVRDQEHKIRRLER